MKRFQRSMGLAGRLFAILVAAAFLSVVGLQYARVIGQNVALARSLHDVETDITSLQAKRVVQERDIRRLSDPRGAIPEIHDRLHLVDRHEAIIYIKGSANGSAEEPPPK
jgi:cell division protein FtsB